MVKGIFSGLAPGRKKAEAEAERQRLLELAFEKHMALESFKDVAVALGEAGAPAAQIAAINKEAAALAEKEIVASVPLPASARLEFNYYFLLGVTPRASTNRIRGAYRRKAKEVHPDIHARDFAAGQWDRFMGVLTDANAVLGDPMKRRAYDIFWRRRSQELAVTYRRPGERRGDWETRFLWEIAEMGEREEALVPLVERLTLVPPGSAERSQTMQQLINSVVAYEAGLVEIRTDTLRLPEHLAHFSERARSEMQRKERLVSALRDLLRDARAATTGGTEQEAASAAAALAVLAEIRQAQHTFDLIHARSHI